MDNRRKTYSLLVVLMTVISLSVMVYRGKINYILSMEYEEQYLNFYETEDREYLGYIFEDYNKPVNLDYVDKLNTRPVDSDSVNTISLSILDVDNNRDNMRSIRSERIIEGRAARNPK